MRHAAHSQRRALPVHAAAQSRCLSLAAAGLPQAGRGHLHHWSSSWSPSWGSRRNLAEDVQFRCAAVAGRVSRQSSVGVDSECACRRLFVAGPRSPCTQSMGTISGVFVIFSPSSVREYVSRAHLPNMHGALSIRAQQFWVGFYGACVLSHECAENVARPFCSECVCHIHKN